MKILLINKFLYPNGGSETYLFGLGKQLAEDGHEVQYFGMEHPDNIVHNRAGAYTKRMDFHHSSFFEKLSYPIKTICSAEARRKIRIVLEDFRPDVCHLNNIHFQLTPSILAEIRKWERESGQNCRIVMTAHDPQLVCPNHLCRSHGENCEKCLHGSLMNCIRGKCIHGSLPRSIIGAAEAYFWRKLGIYREIDHIICCSHFMKKLLDTNPVFAEKTVVLHNFAERKPHWDTKKKDYVLYFGRLSEEKGIGTLIAAAKELPDISFVFAGKGPLEGSLQNIGNIRYAGFMAGEALEKLIREARFSVIPSECYENCPLSVMESQILRTPVLAANIGGIPELIREGETGELFPAGDREALREKIRKLFADQETCRRYAENCRHICFDTAAAYTEKLMEFYR